jgi:predicted nuclease of predicted toxin-antitoxin system
MTFKLLIDECLSPELVAMAVAAGHVQSTCLRDRGWLGLKDWELIERVVAEDFTLVTHNARDFRGQGGDAPGAGMPVRIFTQA